MDIKVVMTQTKGKPDYLTIGVSHYTHLHQPLSLEISNPNLERNLSETARTNSQSKRVTLENQVKITLYASASAFQQHTSTTLACMSLRWAAVSMS